MFKRIGIGFLVAVAVGLGLELAGSYTERGDLGIVSNAEAVVGRPLTPVSVAGVARRTTRRCATGVYDC